MEVVTEEKRDTIFCPNCGGEIEVPKPKVTEVIYHPGQYDFSYGQCSPYTEVYFQEKVTVGHKCPDPNHDRTEAFAPPNTARRGLPKFANLL